MIALRVGDRRHVPALFFLDCDGVIFDVNAAKAEAFQQALAGYPPEARARFARDHAASGGVSRYAQLRHFFTETCPVDDVEAAVEAAAERFAELAVQAYGPGALVAEAMDFLARIDGAARAYVVSGADQEELRGVWDRLGVRGAVADVLGSPTPKRQLVADVLARRGVRPDDALLIGDGGGDFATARAVGVPFVWLAQMSTWEEGDAVVAAAPGAWRAADWAELTSWLE